MGSSARNLTKVLARPASKPRFDWKKARRMRLLYLLLVVPIVYLFIFNYIPMYGVIIAFKDFHIGKGILGSPWNDFGHFKDLFKDPFILRVVRNTFILNVLKITFGFPAPIILALLLNEVMNVRFKKVIQTISYLPYFLSWVILAAIFIEFLSPATGPVNAVLKMVGIKPIYFLASNSWFRPTLVITSIWQGVGWSSVIYLASISAIDPQLYEAAQMDGATRFQRAIHITLPSIVPIISFLAIMNMGSLLNSSFDQVFNLLNPIVYEVGDVIDTYVYRAGIQGARYDYAAAIGLSVNIVGIFSIILTNSLVKRVSEYGLW